MTQGFGPGRVIAPRIEIKPQCLPHVLSGVFYDTVQMGRTHKRSRLRPRKVRVLPVPRLPLLTQVNRLQQIGAGVRDVLIINGSEIGDRHAFDRRRGKKKITDGRVSRLSKPFELLERRLAFAAFPEIVLGKPTHQAIDTHTGAFARPAQQFRVDVYASHAGNLAPISVGVEAESRHTAPLTSIFPVTAAVMSAARYSLSFSMADSTLASIWSVFAVSWSR